MAKTRSPHRERAKSGKIKPPKLTVMGKSLRAHNKKLRPKKLFPGTGPIKKGYH